MTEEQERQLRRRWLLWRLTMQYGIGLFVILFYVTVSFHFRSTPDDTYIYLQYAKNIAAGEGFAFNAGSHSYGITAPLWAFVIAGGTSLGLDPFIVAKTLDLVFASLALVAVFAFAFIVLRDRIYALAAACIFSFDAWFLRWSSSGGDTSLAILLVLLAFWYAYKKEYLTASLVAGLLTLVRPDGILLFIAALVDLVLNHREKMSMIRTFIGSVLVFSGVVLAWMLYAAINIGSVIPAVFQTSTNPGIQWEAVGHHLLSMAATVATTQFMMVVLLVVGVVVSARTSGFKAFKEDGFPLIWVILVPLFYLLANVPVDSRTMLPVLPILVIYGMWGLKRLEFGAILPSRRAVMLLLVVASVSLAQNQYIYQRWFVNDMNDVELGVSDCLKPVAYWLRANTPAGTTVVSRDVGVLGYISDRTIIDREGITTPSRSLASSTSSRDSSGQTTSKPAVGRLTFVFDKAAVPDRLKSDSLVPIMTRAFPDPRLLNDEMMFYTLYEVTR